MPTLIVRLHLGIRPPAVAGLIVAGRINPIDRRTLGPITHIGIEPSEGGPFRAAFHAQGSIPGVVLVLWVASPLTHGIPAVVSQGWLPCLRATTPAMDLAPFSLAGRAAPTQTAVTDV